MNHIVRSASVALVGILTSCGPPDPSAHTTLDHRAASIESGSAEDDRCPLLLDCAGSAAGLDGCPDPEIAFQPGSAELSESGEGLLRELAAEIAELGASLHSLRLVGYGVDAEPRELASTRAQVVRDRLVAHGVSAAVLEVSSQDAGSPANAAPSGWVAFDARCGASAAAAPRTFWLARKH
jgi:hypothetical protein